MFCHSPNLEDAKTKYGPNWPYQWTMDMVHPSISSLASLTSFTFLNFCLAFIIAVVKRWFYIFTETKKNTALSLSQVTRKHRERDPKKLYWFFISYIKLALPSQGPPQKWANFSQFLLIEKSNKAVFER